jgi:hypothetical protein
MSKPQGLEWLEGLDTLKIFSDLFGTRNRDLKACSIVLQLYKQKPSSRENTPSFVLRITTILLYLLRKSKIYLIDLHLSVIVMINFTLFITEHQN